MKKTVLVVGAAGGVGLEVTKLLLQKNFNVIATVLDDNEAKIVSESAPGVSNTLNIDLSDADSIKPKLDPVLNDPDIELTAAIVCAAISPIGTLESTPLSMLRKTLEINMVSDVAVYQTCMPYLRESKGRLIVIASFAGRSALPCIGHYSASKFALEGVGDVMRREAAKFGVDIVIIEPGAIKTNMSINQLSAMDGIIAALSDDESKLYGDLYRKVKSVISGATAGMKPIEVAEVIISALESEKPETRYQVGQDAIDIINLAFNASDAENDEFYRKLYDGEL